MTHTNTEAVSERTFSTLREANVARQRDWCPDQLPDLSFRGNELAGETGEVCNVIKKLERERLGWRGSRDTVEHLAEELGDVIICADLIAISAGIDLDAAVEAKFNATSEKVGLPHRLSRRSASNTGGDAAEVVRDLADLVAGDTVDEFQATAILKAKVILSSPAAEAEPVAQGSCTSCNGTGDLGGNPSYGMCPDCDGTGKFPPAPSHSSSVSAEMTVTDEMVGEAMQDAWDDICSDTDCHPLDIERQGRSLFFRPAHWSRSVAMHIRAKLKASINGGRENG